MSLHLEAVTSLANNRSEDAKTAATQFEAYFLRLLLKEVRTTTSNTLLDGGTGGKMFREMLDEAMADSMAEAGGLGLADMIEKELAGDKEGSAAEKLAMAASIARSESYRTSGRRLQAYGDSANALTTLPVDGARSSSFGERSDPITGHKRFHAGIDMAAPHGSAVRASGAGTVVRAERAGGYGNLVEIDHGGGMTTRYAHLSSMDVKAGDIVEAGASVGAVGSTGRSTGPHLHFEVRRDGKAVDPRKEISLFKDSRKWSKP